MSQNINNKSLFNKTALLRVTLLVACFVFLFAFIMVNGENIEATDGNVVISSESTNVAEALLDTEDAEGGTKSVYGNSGTKDITIANFVGSTSKKEGFPGVDGDTSWTYDEGNIVNFSADTISSQFWKDGGVFDLGTTKTYNGTNYTLAVNGTAAYPGYIASAFNYKLSSDISMMISNDNINVTCTPTYSFNQSSGRDFAYGIRQNTTVIKGEDVKNNTNSIRSNLVGSGSSLALTKGAGYVCFVVYCRGNAGLGDAEFTLSNFSLKFTFTLNNVSDSSTTSIADGSAPVVASQYESATIDKFSPYLTTTAATCSDAQGSSTSSWPLYYDSIASNLSKATDSIVNGTGKLRSYTNTFSTFDSKQYYKYSKVTYIDTYNYAKSGGYSYSTMQGLKDGSGNLDLDKIKNYLKYAGLADKYVNVSTVSTAQIANESYLTYANGNVNISSGIKQVIVGNQYTNTAESAFGAVFNIYELSNGGSAIKTIYGTTVKSGTTNYKEIGKAKVTKTNRGKIVVECYIWDNDDVTTKVTDYGNLSSSKKITYSGIDTSAPTSGSNKTQYSNSGAAFDTSDYIKTDINSVLWYRSSSYTEGMSIELYLDDSDDIFSSPYVWFLVTHRADSASALAAIPKTSLVYDKNTRNVTTAAKNAVQPLAFNTLTSFTYDFAAGKAKGYGSSTANIGNPADVTETISGYGYYRFDIYLFDLVGNAGQVISYCMKVDYEAPSYGISLSYIDDTTSSLVNIESKDNGIKWATGATTLTLSSTKLNQSGNTIVFEDGDGNQHSIGYNATKGITRYDSTKYPSGISKVEGVSLLHALGKTTKMDIDYSSSAGKYNITFTFTSAKNDGLYDDVAWISNFNMYICDEYSNVDEIESDDMAIVYSDTAWKGGVNVLIDRNNPIKPTMTDSDEEQSYIYIGNNDYSSTIKGERIWWTGSLSSFGIYLGFRDDLQTSDYAKDVKVYYGVKVVYNQADLDALKLLAIENNYKSITKTNYSSYLDNLTIKSSDGLDELNTEMSIDLLSIKNSGMRMIYVWAIDQAGNISELNTYYILADANKYSIASSVLNNPLLKKSSASISQTNEDGAKATSFKRGEKVTFALVLDSDYVPYKFNRTYGTGTAETILINNSNVKDWTLVNDANSKIFDYASGFATITYTVDDVDTIASLDTNISFEFAHRQIVNYTVTNTSVVYTGKAAVVPIAYAEGDEAAKDFLAIRFVDDAQNFLYAKEDGTSTTNIDDAKKVDTKPVYFVPTNPGTYSLVTFIDKDDDTFVTYDFALDLTGKQIYETRSFTITKGSIVVTATPTTSTFGDDPVFAYTTDGIDVGSEEYTELIKGQLKLNTAETDYKKLKVGKYQLIVDPVHPFYAGPNFDVTFESDFHTVSAKQLTLNICADQKSYGAVDPEFKFYVVKSGNEGILNDAFPATVYTQITNENCSTYGISSSDLVTNAYYLAGARVSRASGESVGKYKYASDTSLFDISDNYKLVISTTNEFEIVPRNIVLDVSGQSTSVPYIDSASRAAEVNTIASSIVPSYRLAAADMAYVSALSTILNGKLSLDIASVSVSDPVYTYTIQLGTLSSSNFNITLSTANTYEIRVEAADAVIFKLKSNVKKAIVYGTTWNNTSTLKFDLNDFDIIMPTSYKGHNIKSADWSVVLSGVDDAAIPNAGTYLATVSSASVTLKDEAGNKAKFFDNDELTNSVTYSFVFVPFNVTVEQRVITVIPTSQQTSKVYGDSDTAYGFGWEISNIVGLDITDENNATTIAELKDGISGSFARARYEKGNSTPLAFGTKYDDVLAASSNEYYSFAEMQKFQVTNTNYTVVVSLAGAADLTIEPYELNLSFSKFKGISKAYDGSTTVTYTNINKAYELTPVRSADEVELSFVGAYSDIQDSDKGYSSIILTKFGLKGTKAGNYVLGTLDYDLTDLSKGILSIAGVAQTEKTKYTITSDLSIEIMYLGYEGNEDFIHIYKGIIGIHKNDITITKQYDGNKSLNINNISIKNRTDEDGLTGTSMLVSALSNATLVEGFEYDKEYSNYILKSDYVMDLCIKFPMVTAGITAVTTGSYAEQDVQVIIEEDCVKVIIKNAQASITKRVINGSSFEAIQADSRDYNANGDVTDTISFRLKSTALADGDKQSDLEIKLGAEIVGTNYNAGTHAIKFVSDKTSVKNTNYMVDVANMNLVYTGDKTIYVEISKAKLLPKVEFEDREYIVGSAVVTYSGTGELTTLRYAGNLADELNKLSITTAPTYKLSIRGVENGNVVLDDNGLPTAHNVLVKGFVITKTAEGIDLNNYEIYGYRYNDGNYIEVGSFTSGAVIADYELLNQLVVTQKTLTVNQTDVSITSKVYDGEKAAVTTIPYITAEYTPCEAELQYLEIQGTGAFARSQVGANVSVTISDVKLVVKDTYAKSAQVSTYTEYIANYKLNASKIKLAKDILERPIVFDATLVTREYDGTAVATKVNYKLSLLDNNKSTKLVNDLATYSVQTNGGAYFDGKDVAYSADQVVAKDGVIYDPVLRSTRSKYVNYVLVYATDTISTTNTFYDYSKTNYTVKDTDLIAYKTANGDVIYYPASTDARVVPGGTYYYKLKSTPYYVETKDYDSSNADLIAATVGLCKEGYTVTSNSITGFDNSKVKTRSAAVRYYTDGVKGIIEPKSVYISSDGIVILDNNAFEKDFDGTTEFKGSIGIKNGSTITAGAFVYATDEDAKNGKVVCYYDLSKGITGVIPGDVITIGSIQAQYSSANTTAKYVVFSASNIDGKDKLNYTYSKTSVSCKVVARINSLQIYAVLSDYEAEYGTNTQNLSRDLDYYMGQKAYNFIGKTSEVNFDNNKYYQVEFTADNDAFDKEKVYFTYDSENDKYEMAFGITKKEAEVQYYTAYVHTNSVYNASYYYCSLISAETSDTFTEKYFKDHSELIYVKGYKLTWDAEFEAFFMNYSSFKIVAGITVSSEDLQSQTYNLDNGKFVKAKDGVDGEYLKLAGSAILPKSKAYFDSTKPQAGDESKQYILADAYNTNFKYVPRYTGNNKAGNTSLLTLYKKDMFISITAGSSVVMTYAGNTTNTELVYLNDKGNTGIVSGETWMSIFKVGANDYRPTMTYGLATVLNDGSVEIEPIGKYPVISSELPSGQYYVMYLKPTIYKVGETNISYVDVASNYNVYLPTVEYDKVSKVFYYAYYDSSKTLLYKANAITFEIVLPSLTNVSIGDTTGLIAFEYDYDGSEKLSNVVMGRDDNDIITIGADNQTVIHAGEYKGYVNLKRDVMIDENDPNGYFVEWTSSKEITVKINKVAPALYVSKGTKFYDGKEYKIVAGIDETGTPIVSTSMVVYDDKGNPQTITGLAKKYIDITIEKVISGADNKGVSKIQEVATYKIKASLNAVFEQDYKDYIKTSAEAFYTIMPAEISVDYEADETCYSVSYTTGSVDSSTVSKIVKIVGDYDSVMSVYENDETLGISYECSFVDASIGATLGKLPKNIVFAFDKEINGIGLYSFSIGFEEGKEDSNYTFVNNTGILQLTSKQFESESGSVQLADGVIANKLVVKEISSTNATAADNQWWAAMESFMPYVGEGANLASVVRISLYYDNQLIDIDGKATTIEIAVPENLAGYDLESIAIYEVRNGGLEQIAYEIVDGKIKYTTTTLGDLVFVSTTPNNSPSWVLAVVIAVPVAVALFVGAFVLAFISKKRKLQKILM